MASALSGKHIGLKPVQLLCLAVTLALCGCGDADTAQAGFSLTSPVMREEGPIASRFTCDGPGHSPPLTWHNPPVGTKTFALVVEDLDVPGPFVQWVLYDLPPGTLSLPEEPPDWTATFHGGKQGLNGEGQVGYTDICPPRGPTMHHYRFTLYALDTTLGLPAGASRDQVEAAMRGHILGQAALTAVEARPDAVP